MRFLLFFLILWFNLNQLQAQSRSFWIPPEPERLDSILNLVYNMQFNYAMAGAIAYQQDFPLRPEGKFLEGMIMWTEILVDLQNPVLDDDFQKKMDEVITFCNRLQWNDSLAVVARYYKSAALGFKARLYGNRGNWLQSARYGIKAFEGILDAIEGKVKHVDAKFGAGMYYFYADVIPEEYPILKPLLWFYPEGDREKGVKLLMEVSDSGMFADIEATYFLGVLYNNYLKSPGKSHEIFKALNKRFPQNSQYLYWRGRTAFSISEYMDADSCMAVFESRINRQEPYYFLHQLRYIYYTRGLIAEYGGRFQTAFTFYEEAIKPVAPEIEKETVFYYTLSLLRGADMLRRLGYYDDAIERYEQVLKLDDVSRSHERAERGLNFAKELAGKSTGQSG